MRSKPDFVCGGSSARLRQAVEAAAQMVHPRFGLTLAFCPEEADEADLKALSRKARLLAA